jgi:hypothetical protein
MSPFVTNIEHFKTFCSMISTFRTAISGEGCLLSRNSLIKTEHTKADRAGRVRGDASFAATKPSARTKRKRGLRTPKNAFGVRVACHRFVSGFQSLIRNGFRFTRLSGRWIRARAIG